MCIYIWVGDIYACVCMCVCMWGYMCVYMWEYISVCVHMHVCVGDVCVEGYMWGVYMHMCTYMVCMCV